MSALRGTPPALALDDAPAPPPLASDVVLAAARGDRAAFTRLYQTYAPIIHGILLAHGAGPDADDLTQEVFLKALRSISTLRAPEAVGAWLAAAARNEAASAARSRTRGLLRLVGWAKERARQQRTPIGAAGDADSPIDPDEALAAIGELPEAYRESLVLRLVEGLTGPQIAAHLGMTHGSVRVNLTRGMALLRERLAPLLATAPHSIASASHSRRPDPNAGASQ